VVIFLASSRHVFNSLIQPNSPFHDQCERRITYGVGQFYCLNKIFELVDIRSWLTDGLTDRSLYDCLLKKQALVLGSWHHQAVILLNGITGITNYILAKYYCSKAGIETNKKLNLHCLRKGYGTNLVKIGTPANTLKELMGHSSIVTTMKFYVNSIDANKKKAVEGLDRLMGEPR
jgi:hypothetical protein